MSPLQAQYLMTAMICVGALVAGGWIVSGQFYSWLGYPPTPQWARTIRLSDDMATVREKLKLAMIAGFKPTCQDHENLIIEKVFTDPTCLMKFEVRRGGAPWQCLSVECLQHRWLSWSSSSGRNW
jgi:hypothetical protein